MTPHQHVESKLRTLGKDFWVAIGNAQSAATMIVRFPADLTMASMNMGIASRCVATDRQTFMSLLALTDPTDPSVTVLNLIARSMDNLQMEAANLSRALDHERTSPSALRQPGDPITINQIADRICALVESLSDVGAQLSTFEFPRGCPCPTSASHPSEVNNKECPCHAHIS